jgi:hypothetical protein
MALCSALMVMSHLGLVVGLVNFHSTYKYGDDDMDIGGYEPDGNSSGLPVYLWIMGTGDTYGSEVDREWLKAMANRGFIAGAVNYSNSVEELKVFLAFEALKELQESWKEKAKKLVPSAISELCSHPRADCSAGVAVSGHSQGGFISIFSVEYDSRIEAIMPLGIGCLSGAESSLHQSLKDVEVSKYLSRQKRLYITGQADVIFSEKCLSLFSYNCTSSGNDCRRVDGSGYMVVPEGPHNFYGTCDPSKKDSKLKCSYGLSSEPWGLVHAANWLANAASPSNAITHEQHDATMCVDKAISDMSGCDEGPGMVSRAAVNIADRLFLGLALATMLLAH